MFGEVSRPGYYTITAEITLLGLISRAGGLKPDKKIVIYREIPDIGSDNNNNNNQEPIILDINELLRTGDPTGDITLTSGDVICLMNEKDFEDTFVHKQQVYITGQIKNPGAYQIRSASRRDEPGFCLPNDANHNTQFAVETLHATSPPLTNRNLATRAQSLPARSRP